MRQQSLKNSVANDFAAEPRPHLTSVSGDYGENQVRILQNLIYGHFADIDQQTDIPIGSTKNRTERVISVISRMGGVAALIAALYVVATVIF
ncbi:hypothetical protein BH09PSE3_BH09PSE3_24120 [soil metagenome]